MGFPVGYTDIFLPKLVIHTLSLLGLVRKLILAVFTHLGLSDFLERDIVWVDGPTHVPEFRSVSAVLIREILPVVKFSDLAGSGAGDPPENCAVCLYEFEEDEEIRRLTNCRHIFHRSCLDRWMDCDQKTCPLCRTPFVPDEMQGMFNERLWAASGIPEFYGDYSPISGL